MSDVFLLGDITKAWISRTYSAKITQALSFVQGMEKMKQRSLSFSEALEYFEGWLFRIEGETGTYLNLEEFREFLSKQRLNSSQIAQVKELCLSVHSRRSVLVEGEDIRGEHGVDRVYMAGYKPSDLLSALGFDVESQKVD